VEDQANQNIAEISIIVPIGKVQEIQGDFLKHLSDILSRGFEVLLIITPRDADFAKTRFGKILLDFPNTLRLFFFDFDNQGVARNIGLQLAKSTWIVFLDDDDCLELENLVELLRLSELDNSDVGVGAIRVLDAQTMKSKTHLMNKSASVIDNVGVFPAFTRMIYRKSFIQNSRFAELTMGEDQFFLLSIFSNHPKICVADLVIYEYKINTDGQVTKKLSSCIDLKISIELCLDIRHVDIRLTLFFIYRQFLSLLRFGFKGRIRSLFVLGIKILRKSFLHPLDSIYVIKQIFQLRTPLI